MLQTILAELRGEIEDTHRKNTRDLIEKIEGEIAPMKQAQEEFFRMWSEQIKAWRRARSDMQLYFNELKRRDTLREEYTIISDSIDMLIDLHKVNMQLEGKEKKTQRDLEVNQLKYGIIDRIKNKMQSVRKFIGASLMSSYEREDILNL